MRKGFAALAALALLFSSSPSFAILSGSPTGFTDSYGRNWNLYFAPRGLSYDGYSQLYDPLTGHAADGGSARWATNEEVLNVFDEIAGPLTGADRSLAIIQALGFWFQSNYGRFYVSGGLTRDAYWVYQLMTVDTSIEGAYVPLTGETLSHLDLSLASEEPTRGAWVYYETPEPSTLTLLGLAGVGFSLARRRRAN